MAAAPTLDRESDTLTSTSAHLRRFGSFALLGAIWTYALIVFGGIVRITGSGMGCGAHWPKCNGHWIPPFTPETLIEYTHRLLGVSICVVLIGVFTYAVLHRNERGFAGSGGVLRPAALVLALVVVQGVLGAITVWFEIPPIVVVVHFTVALTIMAVLILAAMRARSLAAPPGAAARDNARVDTRAASIAAALGFLVVVFGALVANNSGAPQACQGFPLCNGSVLPRGGSLVHIHWTHRLLAFATFFFVIYQALRLRKRGAPRAVRVSAAAAAATVVLQVIVAAGLVMLHLPPELQALHLAAGAAVWATLVVWFGVAKSHNRRAN